jgi:nitroreductase
MGLDQSIFKRKSCRAYTNKKVSWESIGAVLEAGTFAPSASNLQNWTFIVVTDEGKREKLAHLSMKQTWMMDAPVHIVVCNETSKVKDYFGERGNLYGTQNCAVAAAFMMLKAEDIGLGSCWVGGFDVEGVKTLLEIPADVIPELILTLGYPDRLDKEPVRMSVTFATFFDSYGKRKLDYDPFPLAKQTKKLQKMKEKGLKKLKALPGKLKKLGK